MSALARGLSRMLIAIGVVTLLTGVLVVGAGLYVGTWPLRHLARRDGSGATQRAVQELALAALSTVAVFRGRR